MRISGAMCRRLAACEGPQGAAFVAAEARAAYGEALALAATMAADRGPYGAAAVGGISPQGGAHDARPFAVGPRTDRRQTPPDRREPEGQDARRALHRGALSLGYLSLGTQRKVTRRPEGTAKALALKALALQLRATPTISESESRGARQASISGPRSGRQPRATATR